MSSNRNSAIDVARGLGIVAVVIGHSMLIVDDVNSERFRVIWSFHMPLFFLFSGIFIRTNGPFMDFARSRLESVLKPFLVVMAFWMLLHLPPFSGKAIHPLSWKEIAQFLYGTIWTLPGPYLSFWFLPHLFIASLAAACFCRVWAQQGKTSKLAMAAALVLFMAAGVYYLGLSIGFDPGPAAYWFPGGPGLPWSLGLLPTTLPFIVFGYAAKEKILSLRPNRQWFLFGPTLFVAMHYFFTEWINYAGHVYTSFFGSTIQALSGIYTILGLAVCIDRHPVARKALAFMGRGSLVVYVLHIPILNAVYWRLMRQQVPHFAAGSASIAVSLSLSTLAYFLLQRYRMIGIVLLPRSEIRRSEIKRSPV